MASWWLGYMDICRPTKFHKNVLISLSSVATLAFLESETSMAQNWCAGYYIQVLQYYSPCKYNR